MSGARPQRIDDMIRPLAGPRPQTQADPYKRARLGHLSCSGRARHPPGRDVVGDQKLPVPGSQGTLLPVHGAVANAPTRGAGTQARSP